MNESGEIKQPIKLEIVQDAIPVFPELKEQIVNLRCGENVAFPDTLLRQKPLNPEDQKKLQDQWNLFHILKTKTPRNSLLERARNSELELPKGTLLHGSVFDLNTFRSIAESGIISGEFFGKGEDGETHYCADFYRTPQDFSLRNYLEWIQQPEDTQARFFRKKLEASRLPAKFCGDNVAFIINTQNPEIQPLLAMDAYHFDETQAQSMSGIVNKAALLDKTNGNPDLQKRARLSAILCGIPSNFISGILFGSKISIEDQNAVKNIFGSNIAYFSSNGEVIV